jgi:hypothetical protein
VLVSPHAISSGEGLPIVFTKSGRCAIVSGYGTDGAFGMNGLQAIMPLDLYILFPAGVSLDQPGTIPFKGNLLQITNHSLNITVFCFQNNQNPVEHYNSCFSRKTFYCTREHTAIIHSCI